MRTPSIPVPAHPPTKIRRAKSGGDVLSEFSVDLKIITPILGGAAVTRTVDEIDVIRAPTIRGHLRFWWRALNGHTFTNARELAEREKLLFGGMGDDQGIHSSVELRVIVKDKPDAYNADRLGAPGSYALWPARSTRTAEPAPRRPSGVKFTLFVACNQSDEVAIKQAIRAWIVFGGYGSRTRRGVGSIDVASDNTNERANWLPNNFTRGELRRLFGSDLLDTGAGGMKDLPLLVGSDLLVGSSVSNAEQAWDNALKLLNEFRQGTGADGSGAREPGTPQRPGRSNWPEPDKVRRLSGHGPWQHEPRHSSAPAWPRAGFGLPIITRFQARDKYGNPYRNPEPAPYELHWLLGRNIHERLASPLILKATSLADGCYAPLALWLNRSYPNGGQVVAMQKDRQNRKIQIPGSAAPFDQLIGQGETILFRPLEQGRLQPEGKRLRKAFIEWLKSRNMREVQ
jgi:CRISPR-associated protein Cmr1